MYLLKNEVKNVVRLSDVPREYIADGIVDNASSLWAYTRWLTINADGMWCCELNGQWMKPSGNGCWSARVCNKWKTFCANDGGDCDGDDDNEGELCIITKLLCYLLFILLE